MQMEQADNQLNRDKELAAETQKYNAITQSAQASAEQKAAAAGTRKYADGGYASPITPPDPALAELPVLIKRLCNVLDRIDKNGVSANIGVTELEAQQKRLQKARQWAE